MGNYFFLICAILAGFAAKLSPMSPSPEYFKLFLGLSKVLLIIIGISLFCVLSVALFEYFFLKIFKFKGKYFLTEKYIWALTLPYVIAFMLQMGFGVGNYASFSLIYTLVPPVILAVVAYTKGHKGLFSVLLSVPISYAYFFMFGLSFVLWMAIITKMMI